MTREEAIGVLEDVRDAICENIPGSHPELDELKEAVQMAVNALEERKKGKWINEGIYGEGHSQCSIRCSNCDWHYIGYLDDYKFCPNCGSYNGGE